MKHFIFILALAFVFTLSVQAYAATPDEQRVEIQQMKSTVLSELYKDHPTAEKEIAAASGYAAFSSADVAAVFLSGSYGHGIAHNNHNGDETYMQMASAGVGVGLGAKNFRVVFVFKNDDAFRNFVSKGLDLSVQGDLAAKKGAQGGAVGIEQNILPGVEAYQLTDTGLLAQAMLKGTKYWRDRRLNEYDQSSDAETSFVYND